MRMEDLDFHDNIKTESECYEMPYAAAVGTVITSPQVISQHSQLSSLQGTEKINTFSEDAESTVGA